MNEVKVAYNGTEIEYQEDSNKWRFTLRGRERLADTLAKAKEIISKPPPEEKAEFKPIEAWLSIGYGRRNLIPCRVTSIAAQTVSWRSAEDVWVTYTEAGKTIRKKARGGSVFPRSEANDATVESILKLDQEIETLANRRAKLEMKLKPIKLPKAEAEAA